MCSRSHESNDGKSFIFPPTAVNGLPLFSMKDSRYPHCHKEVSTWLLTVTLFLGLFACYTSNASSQQTESQKTELVVSIKTNPKRAASYTRAFAQIHRGNRCDFHQSEFDLLTCFHNRLFKTRIDENSRCVSSLRKPARFFQRKTLPQNTDEDLFTSSRG